MLEIDHVIAVVADLDRAVAELASEHGLTAVTGGRHEGHGTGNALVPLGFTYIELMAVLDPAEAATSPLGRWAAEHAADGVHPISLCLRTDDIAPIAASLGEDPLPMSRLTPDGRTLSWRLAGFDGMIGPNRRPFFIEWSIDPGDHPGRTEVSHASEATGIGAVRIGDPGPVRSLVDEVDGLVLGEGTGVSAVTVLTRDGEITLD